MFYLVKTPSILKKIYSKSVWSIPTSRNEIFLTFDDGPHPVMTPFVLDQLNKYDAKATFFCIGKNVVQYPDVYKRIIDEGHSVANHTYNHLNGKKTDDKVYLDDIAAAKQVIDSSLFRPPYGRITRFQLNQLSAARFRLKTIMWSVLSGDFDQTISNDDCLLNVIRNTQKGSIVVFHDSDKAAEKLRYALPYVLEYFTQRGFIFSKITDQLMGN